MIGRVLAFVRSLVKQVGVVSSSYAKGYVDALKEVEEYILDEEWENGVDDEEGSS